MCEVLGNAFVYYSLGARCLIVDISHLALGVIYWVISNSGHREIFGERRGVVVSIVEVGVWPHFANTLVNLHHTCFAPHIWDSTASR